MPGRASEWLLALNEAPDDPALRARFDDWLAASPDHARDWEEMERTYRLMGMTAPVFRREWAAPFPRPRPPAVRRFMPAMAALAAACLALVFAPGLMLRLEADVVTATAETRMVRLDDGSVAHLAPRSALDVAFGKGERRVRLLKGEAFFEVVPDAARPFRVAAGNAEATVLGTAFDVRRHGGETWVGVRHGHVRMDGSQVSEHLHAGDWASLGPAGDMARGRRPPEQMAAWTQGELVARNESVAGVIDAIRPYYGGVIVLRGEALARQPLTGVYRLSDPAEAVRAIAETQGAAVYRISPWVLVVSGE
jgi:Fe2+-dicitrate sensor, membrane component